ncbi:MAG: hypothetical protein MZV64_36920 [Ignavibacteriales bacterium]|nr:hypothetical protein [Ignavibacteriales bacterium]
MITRQTRRHLRDSRQPGGHARLRLLLPHIRQDHPPEVTGSIVAEAVT